MWPISRTESILQSCSCVFSKVGRELKDFLDEKYLLSKYRWTYTADLPPIRHEDIVMLPEVYTFLAPEVKRPRGRPKKRIYERIASSDINDTGEKSFGNRCHICGSHGHNRRTCREVHL
jgi:hypothetical protein